MGRTITTGIHLKKYAIFIEDILSPMENQGRLSFFDSIEELSNILKVGFFEFDAWDKGDIDEDEDDEEKCI